MNLHPWLVVIFISMLPWIELRGSIPIALASLGMHCWEAFILAVLANMIPVPFILLFFKYVERFLCKSARGRVVLDKLYEKTRKRASERIRKYEIPGLIAFVAIPAPFTGAWTGALIAYLFGLEIYKSILTIFVGVLIAGFIVTLASVGVLTLF